MDALATLLSAIAWPIAAVTIVAMLRKPIVELIPFIDRLKYKEFEVIFGRDLSKIEDRAEEEAKELPHKTEEDDDEEKYFLEEIRGLPPRAAILETWLELEHTLMFLAQKHGLVNPDRRPRLREALETLQRNELVFSQDRHDIDELRRIRNSVVHERDISVSESDVERYVRAAMRVSDLITRRHLEKPL